MPLHRFGPPPVAVAAQQSGLTVLHHDRRFEQLKDLLRVNGSWIAEPAD
jgi:hypothetical protein